jgi:hypothetical protein
LPAGVVIDGVRWKGQPADCIAVVLPRAQLEAWGCSGHSSSPSAVFA